MANLAAEFHPRRIFDHPDPYPVFAAVRHADPPVEKMDLFTRRCALVTTYDDCVTVLRDADTWSSASNDQVGMIMGRTLIEMDGREHTRHRQLVQQMFVPKYLDALTPVLVALAHEIVDEFARDGHADLVQQFTARFPVQVIAHLTGVPRRDYPRFVGWAEDIVGFVRDIARGLDAAAALRAYLLPIVQERRRAPGDDVISKLVTGAVDGVGLTDDEVVNFLRLLIPAGAETTYRLIGSTLFALLANGLVERVRADRTLVPWALEETLRWETPVLFVSRLCTRDGEIHGVPVAKGEVAMVVIASGNRDEARFADPDRFDLDRRAEDHLSFGFGRHHCLGYYLARQEARIAIDAILDRLPELCVDRTAEPARITGLAFRSPTALPVRFRPA